LYIGQVSKVTPIVYSLSIPQGVSDDGTPLACIYTKNKLSNLVPNKSLLSNSNLIFFKV